MGERRNAIFGLAVIVAFIASGLMASAQEAAPQQGSPEIDYPGFAAMTDDVMAYRESRLVSLADFNAMKADAHTIVLDTRSGTAYAMGHIDGAVHLNFSDFTDEKLAAVIPSKDTRILIYCNNNFVDDVEPIVLKRAPLALNIPTFINLYGYGYENIYELGELVSTTDEDVNWVTSLQTP